MIPSCIRVCNRIPVSPSGSPSGSLFPRALLRRSRLRSNRLPGIRYCGLSMSENASIESGETVELEEEPLVKASASERHPPLSRGVKAAICLSHALSTWSERTWAFAVGLIFLDIYKDLFFVSLFGLIQSLASVLFSPSIGVYIDKTDRFRAVCVFYFLQNMGLVLAAVTSLVLLMNRANPSGTTGNMLALAIIGFGILSRVGTMGGTVAIEKDWAKALSGTDSQELAKLNSTLKMIDLTCLIVAPIVSGFLMSFCSMWVAVLQILIYNLIAWFPEVALLNYATRRAPQFLDKAKQPKDDIDDVISVPKALLQYGRSLMESIGLYFRQSSVLAALSLSALHLTVLSFGILMTPYLKSLGVSEAELSIYRGFAAASGVVGAKAFPRFHSTCGLRMSGLISISFFLFCILAGALPSVINLLTPVSSTLQFSMLVWSIAVSRFGLWVFDLSVSQIMQEWVPQEQLGRVSSVQKLLENVFTVFIFVGGLVASDPKDFVWLMIVSVGAVALSFVWFIFFFLKSRFVQTTGLDEIEMANEGDQ